MHDLLILAAFVAVAGLLGIVTAAGVITVQLLRSES